MSDSSHGLITFPPGAVRIQFQRDFDHPPQMVWAALTSPAKLAEWLAPGSIELKPGGRARIDFVDSGGVIDSLVSAFAAGRLLEYSWSCPGEPLRPLRWEIEAREGGTRLTLTLTVSDKEDAARSAAGWDAHLEMLAAALEGVPIKFPFPTFKAARDAYREQLGMSVA